MNSKTKHTIRAEMRARRQALSADEQQKSGMRLAEQAGRLPVLQSAGQVASYRAFGGEISTRWLELTLAGEVFLPRITDFKQAQMSFYREPQTLRQSNLGILEPEISDSSISPRDLDLVLVPLVAFSREGSRLGMGAGFYDRAFAFKREQPGPQKPLLVGLAHHFQECDKLEPDPWDVPLDAIITDQDVFHIKPLSSQ